MSSSAQSLLCRRNAEGHIVAMTRQHLSIQEQQAGAWEAVPADDAEVEIFLHELAGQANPLNRTDIGLVRVLEDLIDVLIDRGVIQFTDLPDAAKVKLLGRRQARDGWARRLELLPDDPEHDVF